MNKIEIGSKVVDVRSGDRGMVTGINYDVDFEDEKAWWVLWETGNCAGEKLWLVESDLMLFSEYAAREFLQLRLPVGE